MDPSPRVRLEVALLDADPAAPAPDPSAPQAGNGERPCLTVLAVAAEADLRRYVRECLRERADLRVVEAASVGAAIAIAAESSPALLVVDEPERAVIDALAGLPAIVIVDALSQGAPASRARCRLLPRPFTGETLMAEVTRLLAT
jgi:hypothetical protein